MKYALNLLAFLLISLITLAQNYTEGSKIEILWSGNWYKGSVLEVKDDKYKVRYDGWSSSWDEWVGKDRLRALGGTSTNSGNSTTASSASGSSFTATSTEKAPEETGANPKAGKWIATVTNGYKGDKLTFTISADGKRVENVEFTGYWRKGTYGIEVLRHLDPPNPFTVTKGAFSAVQQVEKARMWWEMTGRFTSATTAEGTYRAAYAGGANDTYKLKWTAKRVGG